MNDLEVNLDPEPTWMEELVREGYEETAKDRAAIHADLAPSSFRSLCNDEFLRRRVTDPPLRRKGHRSPPPSVGDADALLGKELDLDAGDVHREPPATVGWQAEQIGLGVSRCPTAWGDHQWPTHTAVITLRIAQAVSCHGFMDGA